MIVDEGDVGGSGSWLVRLETKVRFPGINGDATSRKITTGVVHYIHVHSCDEGDINAFFDEDFLYSFSLF